MLNFLGTGSGFNFKLGNNCAYIKENNELFLIDCGEDVMKKIIKYKLLDNIKKLHIVITHTHSDHCGSLGTLLLYAFGALGVKANVYVTDDMTTNVLRCFGVSEQFYNKVEVGTYKFEIPSMNLKLNFFKTQHVDEIETYGINIVKDNIVIYYSGDSNVLNNSVVEKLASGEIDFLYQDTSSHAYKGNAHLYLSELKEIIPKELRNKVYCMHLDEGFNVDEAKKLGFNVAEKLYIEI